MLLDGEVQPYRKQTPPGKTRRIPGTTTAFHGLTFQDL